MAKVFAKSTFRKRAISLCFNDKNDIYAWMARDQVLPIDIEAGKLCFGLLSEALMYAKELGLKIKLNEESFTEEQLTYYQRMV